MIVLPVKPGSPEWRAARLGIPSASRFDCIMTPKSRKPSASADKYLCALVAERLLGHAVDDDGSLYMHRGTIMEAQAITAYEFDRGLDTTEVGFILRDDRRSGCSPDRLVGEDGCLEIKCCSAPVHVSALLGLEAQNHMSQCQGQLWVTGRAWVDLFFYNPDLPFTIIRIERDEEYIADLAVAVNTFCVRLDAAVEMLGKAVAA